MNKLKNTLFGKLLRFAGLLELIMLVIAFAAFFTFSVMNDRDDIRNIQTLILSANRDRYEFAKTRDTIYYTEFYSHLKEIDKMSQEMSLSDKSRELFAAKTEYKNTFELYYEKTKLRGLSEREGLEGDFRNSVHAIEDLIKKSGTKDQYIQMLQARRSEKDFIMRGDKKYIDKVNEAVDKLILASSGNIDIINLARDYKKKFVKLADVYTSLAQIDKELTESENNTMNIVKEIVEQKAEFAKFMQIAQWIFIILSIAVGLIMSFRVAKSIAKPIEKLKEDALSIASGRFDKKIEVDSNDEIGSLQIGFESVRQTLSRLIEEVNMLLNTASEGKLDIRGDALSFDGGYKEIIDGFNGAMDSIVIPLNLASENFRKIANGNIPEKITADLKGDFNYIKHNINICIDSVNLLVHDTMLLADFAEKGMLSERVDTAKHNGDFAEIIGGFNKTLDYLTMPVNMTSDYLARMAKGDIPQTIEIEMNGDFNFIKDNLNTCINSINQLVCDALYLSDSTALGNLKARADAVNHSGDFKSIISGFNSALDYVTKPLSIAANHLDRIAAGDIPAVIVEKFNGDFNPIIDNLNKCINSLNSMDEDIEQLIESQKTGLLSARCCPEKLSGVYGGLLSGINDTIDIICYPMNYSIELLHEYSKGNLNREMEILPGEQELMTYGMREIRNNLLKLTKDVNLIIDNTSKGILSYRADASKHSGEYRTVIEGINTTLDSVLSPLFIASEYFEKISKGNIPDIIDNTYQGDFYSVIDSLNTCIGAVNCLIEDSNMISQSSESGKLRTRADITRHGGDFARIVQGFNHTLDTVVGLIDSLPVSVMSLDKDMNIMFANIFCAEIGGKDIKALLNTKCYDYFQSKKCRTNDCLCAKCTISHNSEKGDVDAVVNGKQINLSVTSVPIIGINGNILGAIEIGVDQTLIKQNMQKAIEGQKEIERAMIHANMTAKYQEKETLKLIQALNNMSEGDLNFTLESDSCSDELKNSKELFDSIYFSLMSTVSSVNTLVKDVNGIADSAKNGELSYRVDSKRHKGEFAEIINGFNFALDNLVKPLKSISVCLEEISTGKIPNNITDIYPGDFGLIKANLNSVIASLNNMLNDTGMLAEAAEKGILNKRANLEKHKGDFKKIVSGINNTLDSVVHPINEAGEILALISKGELEVRMTGEYKGDFRHLKQDINMVADSIGNIISQVDDAVRSAADGAKFIHELANKFEFSAKEQSGNTEMVAAAIEEMSRTIADNAQSASEAAKTAENNKIIALDGSSIVDTTIQKMKDIAGFVSGAAQDIQKLGSSSTMIGEIISVIDDIADQTNLLALNAAIEAARAGEQGRGFAVVADEVRKLAERTTEATRRISKMISNIQKETESVVKQMMTGNEEVGKGIAMADSAGKAMGDIVNSSTQVVSLMNNISAATDQQAAAGTQIARNIVLIADAVNSSLNNIKEITNEADNLSKMTNELASGMGEYSKEHKNELNGALPKRLQAFSESYN